MDHPTQPIIIDSQGVRRFKANQIVKFLIDNSNITLNYLSTIPFDDEDRKQFMQLLGYSVDGYHDIFPKEG